MIYQHLAKLFLICSDGEMKSALLRVAHQSAPPPGSITTKAGIFRAMRDTRTYYVYILASRRYGTLYIGVTNNVRTRLEQHRAGRGSKFVRQYEVFRLVHVEEFGSPQEAISREKQLKEWRRDWRIRLIEEANTDWSDVSGLL